MKNESRNRPMNTALMMALALSPVSYSAFDEIEAKPEKVKTPADFDRLAKAEAKQKAKNLKRIEAQQ